VQILVPFSDATLKVDINNEWMKAQDLPSEPSDKNPQILIGYIPPSKKAELMHRSGDVWRGNSIKTGGTEEEARAQIEAVPGSVWEGNDEVAREWVRWGVRGHDCMPVPYAGAKESYRGKDRPVASPDMVELYEANGWLYVLARLVREFNTLDAEKKRPS
jgi:hypothetical protein